MSDNGALENLATNGGAEKHERPRREMIACPACGHRFSRVADSRPHGSGGIIRRRECLGCKVRWSTLEHSVQVWKRNQSLALEVDGLSDAPGQGLLYKETKQKG